MQTMEMIVIRKKRIAIAKKQMMGKVEAANRKGIWEMISSVRGNRSNESKVTFLSHFLTNQEFYLSMMHFRCDAIETRN